MPERSSYPVWLNSAFYHKLYQKEDEEDAKDFLFQLIKRLDTPAGCRMLDIGCSRGKKSKTLASLGFEVTGIDLSPGNINHAKQFESENLQFFIHDIRRPFWINYFDHAFCLAGLGYYDTRREYEDVIRTIAGSLKPGAWLIMDQPNIHYAEEHLLHNETKKIDDTIFTIHRWDDEMYFYEKMIITDPSLNEREEHTIKKLKFSLGDLTDMLAYHGLQVQQVFGNYEFSEYHIQRSPRLILIAREKSNDPEDEAKRLYSDGRTTDALT